MGNTFKRTQKVTYGSKILPTTAAYMDMYLGGSHTGGNKIENLSNINIKNVGRTAIEIKLDINEWTAGTPDADSDPRYLMTILGAGESMFLPTLRMLSYSAGAASAGSAYLLSNTLPSEVNSEALFAVSSWTLGAAVDDTDTTITVNTDQHDFYVGDLIQIGTDTTTSTRQEIMRVTGIGVGAANNTILEVDRALYGTSKADKDTQNDATEGATSGSRIHLPFFNITQNSNHYGGYATAQSDLNGVFHIMNFFGYGRYTNSVAGGITPGTIAGKFFTSGYQEFGMRGQTSSSNSGLTAGATYGFDITVNGSGLLNSDTMTFTVDNTNWGGTNGVLSKIQAVFDTQYYTTSSNILNERVTIGIVGGDIRITSQSRLSTSAILLAAPSEGETTIFGVGRIPAIGSIESPVSSVLPPDSIYDRKSGIEMENESVYFYDDGNGNIRGAASGYINYTTGELYLTGCPPEAHLSFSANYGAAHSGGIKVTSGVSQNSIYEISARSCNHKVTGLVEITATEQ